MEHQMEEAEEAEIAGEEEPLEELDYDHAEMEARLELELQYRQRADELLDLVDDDELQH